MNTHARSLRKHQTDAERRLWFYLKNRRFGGHKFRRQHTVGLYIIDFYCAELLLGIELDGGGHQMSTKKEYDEIRTRFLNERGIKIIRFWNNGFMSRTDDVLRVIWKSLTPSP